MAVDGRTVAYFYSGSGPSVVFESGLGDGYEPWQTVLTSVSAKAAVFAYDRAGYGGSTAVTGPRDGTHLVAELQRNLDAAHVPAPYLLVGHSLGGPLVLLYARLHPDAVAGVVLVDARPAQFTDRCIAELGEAACVPSADLLAQLPPTQRAEFTALADTMKELLAAPPFPEVPVVVLTHSKASENASYDALWSTMQDELATELSATHQVVANTGHHIQRDAPSAVIDAITELLTP